MASRNDLDGSGKAAARRGVPAHDILTTRWLFCWRHSPVSSQAHYNELARATLQALRSGVQCRRGAADRSQVLAGSHQRAAVDPHWTWATLGADCSSPEGEPLIFCCRRNYARRAISTQRAGVADRCGVDEPSTWAIRPTGGDLMWGNFAPASLPAVVAHWRLNWRSPCSARRTWIRQALARLAPPWPRCSRGRRRANSQRCLRLAGPASCVPALQ